MIGQMAIAIALLGFNDLGCSVTPNVLKASNAALSFSSSSSSSSSTDGGGGIVTAFFPLFSFYKTFSIEERKENDLIIKAATGNIKTRTIRSLIFSQTLQAVRINNQGAPLLGLAKSIY